MVDLGSFREEHPELCPEDRIRVPGLGEPAVVDARAVGDWEEALEAIGAEDLWRDPAPVRKRMQAGGAEAFGHYRSFRLAPAGWGIYLQGRPLVGFAQEVLRVLRLGFLELEERVPDEKEQEVAFNMAYDIVFNHLSLHASTDAFAAQQEVEDGTAYYAPYQEGPYEASLKDMTGPDGYNWEEVLANVVSLSSFLNPTRTVEFGGRVDSYFNDEEKFRWNGFLMSGMLTSELTYVMRPFPASHKNFTEFLRRRGEVGPYAHMAIQYDLNTDAFHAGLRRLATVVLAGKEREGVEKALLTPVNPPIYLSVE
ncbi:MAG: hypothetical protein ACE5I4_00535 [Thermoplasmata archaeon]